MLPVPEQSDSLKWCQCRNLKDEDPTGVHLLLVVSGRELVTRLSDF
jgi:hypothetical protein